MRPVQLARLVKNNDLQAASPHRGKFAFGFKAAAKRPLEDNKGENKQEQARIKRGAASRPATNQSARRGDPAGRTS
jgi:hypothetical protein